ncbi:MAG: hypothetical protein WCW27_04750 [Patescibacteria group bacterium]|jgi:hypothetical protein
MITQPHKKPVVTTILLGIACLIACVIGIIPIYFNKFPLTTPDAGGLACAADTLAKTHQFTGYRTTTMNFAICWTKQTYPAVQYFNAILLRFIALPSWQLVPIATLLMYLGCVISMFFIGKILTKSNWYGCITAILASASPALLRPLILTPQNVYGYFLMLILLLIFSIASTKNARWWLLTIPIAGLLAFTHTLSFGIAVFVFVPWFILFFLDAWLWRIVLILLPAMAVYFNEQYHFLPVTIKEAWSLFNSSYSGYDHPLWDHPAIWGYIITALAAVGIALSTKLHYKIKSLLIMLIVVPVLLGHLSFIGIQLLPERFVPFTWIGLVIFAGIGLANIQEQLRLPKTLWVTILIVLASAQITHAVVFIKDDVDGWSARFRPHPEFIEAVQWLNTQPDKGALLGIMAVSNREISFAPLWYDGMIENYPWYNLDHKNIKNFQANSSLYKPILADPTNSEYQRIKTLFTLINTPNDPSLPTALTGYNLTYFILPKTSQAYKIWQKERSVPFDLIYENEKYIIYALK